MTRSTILLLISMAPAHGLNAQAAPGLRVGLTNIAPVPVDVGRSTREPARLSLNSNFPLINSAAGRDVKNSDAPLLGVLIGALVGGVSFRLLADNHVDNPGNYTTDVGPVWIQLKADSTLLFHCRTFRGEGHSSGGTVRSSATNVT